jgi:alpha-glucosidase
LTGGFKTPPDTLRHYVPLGVTKVSEHDDERVRLEGGSTTIEVAALAPDLFRVGTFPEGRSPRYFH